MWTGAGNRPGARNFVLRRSRVIGVTDGPATGQPNRASGRPRVWRGLRRRWSRWAWSRDNPQFLSHRSIKGTHQEVQLCRRVWWKFRAGAAVVFSHLRCTIHRSRNVGFDGVPQLAKCCRTLVVVLSPRRANGVLRRIAVQEWAWPVAEMEQQPDFHAWCRMANVDSLISSQLQSRPQLMLLGTNIRIEQYPYMIEYLYVAVS